MLSYVYETLLGCDWRCFMTRYRVSLYVLHVLGRDGSSRRLGDHGV